MARWDDRSESERAAEAERAAARAEERRRRAERRREWAARAETEGSEVRRRGPRRERASGEARESPLRRAQAWLDAKAEAAKRGSGTARAGDGGDVVQRRVAAVVILAVVAVVIMALADAAPFFDDTSEEERVSETVERFFAAYEERDFATVCDLFSADVRQAIEQAGATETKQGEPEGCAEILEARFGATDDAESEISARVQDVRVSGPRAIANVMLKSPDTPRGRLVPVELELGPEGWVVTRQVITG